MSKFDPPSDPYGNEHNCRICDGAMEYDAWADTWYCPNDHETKEEKQTVKLYDPYYLLDPTIPEVPSLNVSYQGVAKHLHFGGYGKAEKTEYNFPIDSNMWRSYALGAWNRLARITKNIRLPDLILPNSIANDFSWRMTCEMVEHAADQAEKTPCNEAAIVRAAHEYLARKQYETARAKLDELLGNEGTQEYTAIELSEVLSNWFAENWDLIPEVEL